MQGKAGTGWKRQEPLLKLQSIPNLELGGGAKPPWEPSRLSVHLAGTVQVSPSLQGHEQPQVEPGHPLPRAQFNPGLQRSSRAPEGSRLRLPACRGCAGSRRAGEGTSFSICCLKSWLRLLRTDEKSELKCLLLPKFKSELLG